MVKQDVEIVELLKAAHWRSLCHAKCGALVTVVLPLRSAAFALFCMHYHYTTWAFWVFSNRRRKRKMHGDENYMMIQTNVEVSNEV
jgi:hypothetical protein